VVVLHLVQVVHKFVDLLLANLQSVVKLLVHDLAELKLLGGTQIDEGILGLVEHLLFFQNGVPVLEGVFQQPIELILLLVFLVGQLIHLEQQDRG
jgi:hypothetical protein